MRRLHTSIISADASKSQQSAAAAACSRYRLRAFVLLAMRLANRRRVIKRSSEKSSSDQTPTYTAACPQACSYAIPHSLCTVLSHGQAKLTATVTMNETNNAAALRPQSGSTCGNSEPLGCNTSSRPIRNSRLPAYTAAKVIPSNHAIHIKQNGGIRKKIRP